MLFPSCHSKLTLIVIDFVYATNGRVSLCLVISFPPKLQVFGHNARFRECQAPQTPKSKQTATHTHTPYSLPYTIRYNSVSCSQQTPTEMPKNFGQEPLLAGPSALAGRAYVLLILLTWPSLTGKGLLPEDFLHGCCAPNNISAALY